MAGFEQFRNDFADKNYRNRFREESQEVKEVKEVTKEESELSRVAQEDAALFDPIADNRPGRRKLNATERFGLAILGGMLALVLILVLDVRGIPVVRIAKRTVRKVLVPRPVKTVHDPFKNPEEDLSNDVVVIYRND